MMMRPIFMYPAKFWFLLVLLIELFLMIDLLSCHQINLQVRSIQQCFHHHDLVSGMVLFLCVCLVWAFSFTVHVHIPSFVIVSQWYGKARRSLQWRRAFGNPCSAFQCPRRKVTYRVGFYLHCNLLGFVLVGLIFVLCVPLPSVEYCLFFKRQSHWLRKEKMQVYWLCA